MSTDGGFGFEAGPPPDAGDDDEDTGPPEPELPLAFTLPRDIFRALDGRRQYDVGFLSPSILALTGGAKAQIVKAPDVGRPLPVDEIETLARAWGARGEDLLDVLLDVLAFDQEWLRLEYARIANEVREMNK